VGVSGFHARNREDQQTPSPSPRNLHRNGQSMKRKKRFKLLRLL
jgi:hypothetical protein